MKTLFILVVFLVSCGTAPTGNEKHVVSTNESGDAEIIFALKHKEDAQYCYYSSKHTISLSSSNPMKNLTIEQLSSNCTRLNARTISNTDLQGHLAEDSRTRNLIFNTSFMPFFAGPLCLYSAMLAVGLATPIRIALCSPVLISIAANIFGGILLHREVKRKSKKLHSRKFYQTKNSLIELIRKKLTYVESLESLPCPSKPDSSLFYLGKEKNDADKNKGESNA